MMGMMVMAAGSADRAHDALNFNTPGHISQSHNNKNRAIALLTKILQQFFRDSGKINVPYCF
jgi:hypothetical protein